MKKALLILVAIALACSRESTAPGHGYARKRPKQIKRVEEPGTPPPTDVGATMPPYQAMMLDGKPFDLAAQRDKVVFLNVWATWCNPCRFEIPELEKMHAKYGPRGFEVVGVSIDEEGSVAVNPFLKDQPIAYPIVLDPNGKIAYLLQTSVLPTSIVIDRGGKIVWRRVGALIGPDATLDAAIEKALAK